MTTFRSTTGQTGRDAYLNEAAAISNAMRKLEARMARLTAAIVTENEEGTIMCPERVTDTLTLPHDLTRIAPMLSARDAEYLCRLLLATSDKPATHPLDD